MRVNGINVIAQPGYALWWGNEWGHNRAEDELLLETSIAVTSLIRNVIADHEKVDSTVAVTEFRIIDRPRADEYGNWLHATVRYKNGWCASYGGHAEGFHSIVWDLYAN